MMTQETIAEVFKNQPTENSEFLYFMTGIKRDDGHVAANKIYTKECDKLEELVDFLKDYSVCNKQPGNIPLFYKES